jgi:concentrative nucleoside transporter, CNT family
VTAGKVEVKIEKTAVNVIDAAAQGAGDGLHLALNIGAMLIAFLALIAMLNGILGWVHTLRWMAGCRFAAADFRRGFRAGGVAAGRAVEGCAGHRQPAGHAPGAQRIRGVSATGPMKAAARSALVHHRHLRAVRVRQFQLDRHSDRRHRRAGAEPQIRPGAAGAARGGGGTMANFMSACIAGMLCDCGSQISDRKPHALRPAIGVVLGSGLGAFADELTIAP